MEGHGQQPGPPIVVTLAPTFLLTPCRAPVSHYSFGPPNVEYRPSMFPNGPPRPYAGLLPFGPLELIAFPGMPYQLIPLLPLGIGGFHMFGGQFAAGVLPPFVPPSGNPVIFNPLMPTPSLERGGFQSVTPIGGDGAQARNTLNNNTRNMCNYCRKNGQPVAVYSSHQTHENGRVACPLLPYHRCPNCSKDGHTRKYCPRAGSRKGNGQ